MRFLLVDDHVPFHSTSHCRIAADDPFLILHLSMHQSPQACQLCGIGMSGVMGEGEGECTAYSDPELVPFIAVSLCTLFC